MKSVNMRILIFAAVIVSVPSVFAALTPQQRELLGHSLIHRGDGRGRPDNTMEALLYTWGRGYTPESDIRYTKDKALRRYKRALPEGLTGRWTWTAVIRSCTSCYGRWGSIRSVRTILKRFTRQSANLKRENEAMATVTIIGSGVVVEKTSHNLLIVA